MMHQSQRVVRRKMSGAGDAAVEAVLVIVVDGAELEVVAAVGAEGFDKKIVCKLSIEPMLL
jgi:hypothetical protein